MKKITMVLFCGLFSSAIFAQEQQGQQDFNRWSIELEAGVHWVAEPYAPGYFSSLPSFFQGSLGVRYMLSNRFGLKVDVGYANIEAGAEDDLQLDSQPFQTRYLRTSLQGVINAGDILNFRSWTNTFNLLFHGGGGYSRYTYQEGEANVPVPSDDADEMYHVMAGITPQIKLSDHIVFTLDATFIGNLHQSSTIDGTQHFAADGFDGLMVNGSAGLTFYLGSAEQHADWYTGVKTTTLDSLEQVITAMKDQMLDSDQDGVANYLDQEPNTVNGVAVNTKGIAVDKNDNNIPDELEYELDARYITKAEMNEMEGGLITDLLNKGYVNVYFNFNSTEPTEYSLNAINYLITYMSENPSAEAELIGYADEIGNVEYNQELSLARAQKVEDIMEAAGIDPERLTVTGNGEDDSVEKSSQQARQLVRRVTFRLK